MFRARRGVEVVQRGCVPCMRVGGEASVLKHNTFSVLAEEQRKWHTEAQTLTLSLFLKFYNFIFRATDLKKEQRTPGARYRDSSSDRKVRKSQERRGQSLSHQDAIAAAGAFWLGDSWSSLLQPWKVQIQQRRRVSSFWLKGVAAGSNTMGRTFFPWAVFSRMSIIALGLSETVNQVK